MPIDECRHASLGVVGAVESALGEGSATVVGVATWRWFLLSTESLGVRCPDMARQVR